MRPLAALARMVGRRTPAAASTITDAELDLYRDAQRDAELDLYRDAKREMWVPADQRLTLPGLPPRRPRP